MVQLTTLVVLATLSFPIYGLDLDVTSPDSIKSVASTIASGLLNSYHGTEPGHVNGLLESPYNFWEAGFLWDSLIQYWHLTGDDKYNGLVSQALLFQQGESSDFAPGNQTKGLGNDDQATWALAAMSAAEAKFPEPENITWITLAENVFEDQVARWDYDTCKGGLRWQIFQFNNGYDYKNNGANGDFFRLASRLARYTGNSTYSEWATRTYDWVTSIGLVDNEFNVYDGTHTDTNCTDINHLQWSYYAGMYINGAATMYNITTGDDHQRWKTALDGLLNKTLDLFFPHGIAYEVACEAKMACSLDMKAFKGILAQALVETIKVAPYTADTITPILTTTAKAAALACGPVGTACAFNWAEIGSSSRRSLGGDTNDTGVGEQLSALSYVQGLLVKEAAAPVTEETGGNSASNATVSGGASGTGATSTSPTSSGTGPTSSGTGPTSSGTGSPSSPAGNAGSTLGVEKFGMFLALVGLVALMVL